MGDGVMVARVKGSSCCYCAGNEGREFEKNRVAIGSDGGGHGNGRHCRQISHE